MLKYSNGWGHLIMSVLTTVCGLLLVLFEPTNATLQGLGVVLIMGVNGTWFISGASKSVATEVISQVQQIQDTGNAIKEGQKDTQS